MRVEKVITAIQTVLCFIFCIITLYSLAMITQVKREEGEFKVYEEVNPFLNDYVKNITEGIVQQVTREEEGEFKVYEEVNPFLNDYVKNVTKG